MAPKTRSQAAKASNPPRSSKGLLLAPHPAIELVETEAISSVPFNSVPPTYLIDLSLPPELRYVEVAKDYSAVVSDLTELFDELIESAKLPQRLMHFVARLFLRKLYSSEQTAELRGISKVVNVPMYLLVAYNVFLDMFMGCTSGGILIRDDHKTRMMHFRTLDWGMPKLRKALAQFEFVERVGGPVIARTISYVGFVGVLTGVRKGLSVSLNFRPYHNDDGSMSSNFKFYGHLALVLLGLRPSITAHLRAVLLPSEDCRSIPIDETKQRNDGTLALSPTPTTQTIAEIIALLPSYPTTAAYLTFCDGTQAVTLEKDRISAKILHSTTFLAATNHDTAYESLPSSTTAQAAHSTHVQQHHSYLDIGMKDLVDESMDRKACIARHWQRRSQRRKEMGVRLEELKEWLQEYPVLNSETHFVTIMDPMEGTLRWVRCLEEGEVESEKESGENEV